MMQSCSCKMITMITSMACRSCLPHCSSPGFLAAALQFGESIASSCRMLSPEGSFGQGLYGQRAFSSGEQLSKAWKALTAGCSLDASAAPANAPELDVGQITGVALLESLCVHLQPGAVARIGIASQLLPLLCRALRQPNRSDVRLHCTQHAASGAIESMLCPDLRWLH